jgi:hypothetical protein
MQAFKRKGIIQYGKGARISGRQPGGKWVSRGPFGNLSLGIVPGNNGFSLEGPHRNKGYIGSSSAFSKSRTPYYGQFPKGYGGCCGTYFNAEPSFVSPPVKAITSGQQFEYIKPSVLSTKGMLETRFKWIHNGHYPNFWVQPVYPTGTQELNTSQWLYIQHKAAQNNTVTDTNKPEIYVDYKIVGNPATGCRTTPARNKSFNIISSNRGYTKTLHQPVLASQQTLKIQRKCANPLGPQKPFPFSTPSASHNSTSGINYAPPAVNKVNYVTPPKWYTTEPA